MARQAGQPEMKSPISYPPTKIPKETGEPLVNTETLFGASQPSMRQSEQGPLPTPTPGSATTIPPGAIDLGDGSYVVPRK